MTPSVVLSNLHRAAQSSSVQSTRFSRVFTDIPSQFINDYELYQHLFDVIPNCISISAEVNQKTIDFFCSSLGNQIVESFTRKHYNAKSGKLNPDRTILQLEPDILLVFDARRDQIHILYQQIEESEILQMISPVKKFRHRASRKKPQIGIITEGVHNLYVNYLDIKSPKLNLTDNYNDDFLPVHDVILSRLNKKEDKGVLLLHGKPGTGKTYYIRHLVSILKKTVIFLPVNMAHMLTTPAMMDLLVDHPNSVLVIEDAETVIADRSQESYSPVSALLNISDGLLSDFLNIQIICSFNGSLSRVDEALLRKGRLIAVYEFGDLETDKAKALAQKLNKSIDIDQPTPLAAIYNEEAVPFQPAENARRIGFNRR